MSEWQPKRPVMRGWLPDEPSAAGDRWVHLSRGKVLCVISAVEKVQNSDHSGTSPHWRVSVTASTRRGVVRIARSDEVELVKAAFDMRGADEDNHVKGKARHLWLRCGAAVELGCRCKAALGRHSIGPRVWTDE